MCSLSCVLVYISFQHGSTEIHLLCSDMCCSTRIMSCLTSTAESVQCEFGQQCVFRCSFLLEVNKVRSWSQMLVL